MNSASASAIAAPFITPDEMLRGNLAEQQWLLSFDADLRANLQPVPLTTIAVNPSCDADMVTLLSEHVPAAMLPALIRVAAWRAMGHDALPPDDFTV